MRGIFYWLPLTLKMLNWGGTYVCIQLQYDMLHTYVYGDLLFACPSVLYVRTYVSQLWYVVCTCVPILVSVMQ